MDRYLVFIVLTPLRGSPAKVCVFYVSTADKGTVVPDWLRCQSRSATAVLPVTMLTVTMLNVIFAHYSQI